MSPIIDSRAICVSSDYTLTAIISAYFHKPGAYFSVFDFPVTEHGEGIVHSIVTNHAEVKINNNIKKVLPDYIILAGLNEYQIAFFDWIPREKQIRISSIEEVDQKLSLFGVTFDGEVRVNKKYLMEGLFIAKNNSLRLVIDNSISEPIDPYIINNKSGVVVIEREENIGMVAAINYTHTIDADLSIVEPFPKEEVRKVHEILIDWGRTHKVSLYNQLYKKVARRMQSINLQRYKFATFITDKIPYGFILKNPIPISHISKGFPVQYFIFDNIFYESSDEFHNNSALVFSPKVFKREEIDTITNELRGKNFVIKHLLEKEATLENFRNYVQYFPYDILHICTHGGRMDGYYSILDFKDRNNNSHRIEYYEIVSFSRSDRIGEDGQPMVNVTTKSIFKRFDGLKWKSPELKRKNYPEHVFLDMLDAMRNEDNQPIRTYANYEIPDSAFIKCYDSYEQGNFHSIAANTSPLVFNNSCHSWNVIAEGFIYTGARGYMGTLWNIKNKTAVASAEYFYQSLFQSDTILNNFYDMLRQIQEKDDKDIYIYWGTHFSTMKKEEKGAGLFNLFNNLRAMAIGFIKLIENLDKADEVRKNSLAALKFMDEVFEKDLKQLVEKKEIIPDEIRGEINNFQTPDDLPVQDRQML